ncbi:hypothetical protein [Holdemania massiliensis]|uniref:hypothetical protein n=1 Tax=Holdemania massiliensis TaxID=1468449 RepID=UPI0019D5A430|nr:hypothetical protein [Holdemania massiliensis]
MPRLFFPCDYKTRYIFPVLNDKKNAVERFGILYPYFNSHHESSIAHHDTAALLPFPAFASRLDFLTGWDRGPPLPSACFADFSLLFAQVEESAYFIEIPCFNNSA